MNFASESSLASLRHELSALDYTEPLGAESAPLVQRLLSDLILTTDTIDKLQGRASDYERQANRALEDIAPLRKDTSRLVRENNEVSSITKSLTSIYIDK
jgi:hypothetical protein